MRFNYIAFIFCSIFFSLHSEGAPSNFLLYLTNYKNWFWVLLLDPFKTYINCRLFLIRRVNWRESVNFIVLGTYCLFYMLPSLRLIITAHFSLKKKIVICDRHYKHRDKSVRRRKVLWLLVVSFFSFVLLAGGACHSCDCP